MPPDGQDLLEAKPSLETILLPGMKSRKNDVHMLNLICQNTSKSEAKLCQGPRAATSLPGDQPVKKKRSGSVFLRKLHRSKM